MLSIKKVVAEIESHKRDANAPRGLFPASAADRWLSCPKSSFLAKSIPPEETIYASEGQLAHRVCEAMWNQKMYGIPYPDQLNIDLKQLDDCGEEMEKHAENYLKVIDWINNNNDDMGDIKYVAIEKYLRVDDVTDETRVGGLADYIVIGTKGAAILDFKYGQWHGVGAKHPQLLTYLTALRGIDIQDYKFMAAIYQPRRQDGGNAFGHHTYLREDLENHYKEIQRVRREYESVTTQLTYGAHCRWCPAKRTNIIEKKCPVVDKKQVDSLWDSVKEAVISMEKAKVSKGFDREKKMRDFFAVLPQIEEAKKVFEAELLHRLECGEEVKGFKITERAGRRQWIKEDPEVIEGELKGLFYAELLKKDLTVKKMKPITTIEKWIGKNRLNDYTSMTKPSKKLTVTDEVSVDEILASIKDEDL